jgi:hypothetical protein
MESFVPPTDAESFIPPTDAPKRQVSFPCEAVATVSYHSAFSKGSESWNSGGREHVSESSSHLPRSETSKASSSLRSQSNLDVGRKTNYSARASRITNGVWSVRASIRDSVVAIVDRLKHRPGDLREKEEVKQILDEVKAKFGDIPGEHLKLLSLPAVLYDQEQLACELVANEDYTDSSMVQAMVEIFLNIVSSQYWKLIDAGEMVPGTNEANVLLASIKLAHDSSSKATLCDFEYVCYAIYAQVQRLSAIGEESEKSGKRQSLDRFGHWTGPSHVDRLVDSTGFNAFVMAAIVSNAIFIGMEDSFQNQSNEANLGWLVADLCFTFIFFMEFVLKFWSLRCQYFRDFWNVFDFGLVLLSICSNVLGIVADVSTDVSSESRLVRVARLLRVMRLMRLFRLVVLFRVFKAKLMRLEFSADVAKHLQTMTVLTCFIRAHISSQQEMLVYFGHEKKVAMAELARCMIDSQVQAYKAMALAAESVRRLDRGVLYEVNDRQKSKALAEQLNNVVHHAYKHGVITSREAETVLHPVRIHLQEMELRIREMHFGYIRAKSTHTMRSKCSERSKGSFSDESRSLDDSPAIITGRDPGRSPSTAVIESSAASEGTTLSRMFESSMKGVVPSTCENGESEHLERITSVDELLEARDDTSDPMPSHGKDPVVVTSACQSPEVLVATKETIGC